MPANVRGFGDSPMDWYRSLPPITKMHVTVCVATTLAYMLQLIHPQDLMLHWHFVKKLQVGRALVSAVM
jgi:Der1-like family